jgi:RimJ/RimL family protein N-acetyltransferase
MAATLVGMQSLTTDRLDLVPFDLARDVDDLHGMFKDPEWARGGFTDPSRDVADTRARLEREFGDNGGLTWVLRVRLSESAVGVIGVFSDQGTPIRGMSWYLRRDHWGQGLMSEAALEVVDYLLEQPSVDGIEAWIDSRNVRSIGVARCARLDLCGRLPRVYDTETALSVVMARAAESTDPSVIGVRPILLVRDVADTVAPLLSVLGMHLRFQLGDSQPEFARLGLTRWNDGNGIDVRRSTGDIPPTAISIDLGRPVDPVHDAAVAAGLTIASPPADTPWQRRECTVELPERHQLILSGPVRPNLSAKR